MKRVLISGANRGIGLEHARRFAAAGAELIAAVRKPGEAEELNALAKQYDGRVTVLAYDAADPDGAAKALKAELKDAPLDLLFANAGTLSPKDGFADINADAITAMLRVNTLAGLSLAHALADNVAASDRKLIAFQSSLMGSISDNSSGGYYGYRLSKAAFNMAARSAAQDLKARGITVLALHPGWVQTRMGGGGAPVTVAQCVDSQQKLFAKAGLKESGRFWNYDGRELPW